MLAGALAVHHAPAMTMESVGQCGGVIPGASQVELQQTGVRGTSRSHVYRGPVPMPHGPPPEQRLGGKEVGGILMCSDHMCGLVGKSRWQIHVEIGYVC